jgi:RNA recognition motif-containing protein
MRRGVDLRFWGPEKDSEEMGTRLFVGNVSFETTEQALREHFEQSGLGVTDVVIVTDRETGRSRGFGFVELGLAAEAERAKELLDGQELDGRKLTVREAFERTPRRSQRDHRRPSVEHVGRLDQPASEGFSVGSSEGVQQQRAPDSLEAGGRLRQRKTRRGSRGRSDWSDEEW